MMIAPTGRPAGVVNEGVLFDRARAVAILPDGERFQGQVVVERTRTMADETIRHRWGRSSTLSHRETTCSSRASGVLFGRSGGSMTCALMLNDPSFGFMTGGFGECSLSTGEIIPVQFG
ncbi:hypothetical protein QNA08_13350 [Chelatococcus sp. SYSU_G07232]|uniref:Uncharacterized protein n=1 Tax=Chelatococcus albus TaxID=3047466 RepID=A0ABT7AJD1_9HYPH|nr:hypothetical protein [Chelatococcus sp. SYSU_G07232]MDJ1159220.1 hypothetical protein [Chelatococcus sp. SYSU_G07232]